MEDDGEGDDGGGEVKKEGEKAEVHWDEKEEGEAKEKEPAKQPISLDIDWEDEEEADPERTSIETIFLLSHDSMLMNNYTRKRSSDIDPDVLSSMLMAVQTFVSDSFKEVAGQLDQLQFGDLTIIISQGELVTIAAVIKGPGAAEVRTQVEEAIKDIEFNHYDLVKDWDGAMSMTHLLDEPMKKLVLGEYLSE